MFYRRIESWAVSMLTASLIVFLLPGCGSGDRVEVYPTSGLVKFLGEPMAGGGSISFIPLDGQVGKAAGGTIDSEGRFTVSTYDPDDGSIPGRFRVIIFQSTVEETETIGDTDVEGAKDTLIEFSVPEAKRIPLIYADVAKSPLTVEVKPDATNDLMLELVK